MLALGSTVVVGGSSSEGGLSEFCARVGGGPRRTRPVPAATGKRRKAAPRGPNPAAAAPLEHPKPPLVPQPVGMCADRGAPTALQRKRPTRQAARGQAAAERRLGPCKRPPRPCTHFPWLVLAPPVCPAGPGQPQGLRRGPAPWRVRLGRQGCVGRLCRASVDVESTAGGGVAGDEWLAEHSTHSSDMVLANHSPHQAATMCKLAWYLLSLQRPCSPCSQCRPCRLAVCCRQNGIGSEERAEMLVFPTSLSLPACEFACQGNRARREAACENSRCVAATSWRSVKTRCATMLPNFPDRCSIVPSIGQCCAMAVCHNGGSPGADHAWACEGRRIGSVSGRHCRGWEALSQSPSAPCMIKGVPVLVAGRNTRLQAMGPLRATERHQQHLLRAQRAGAAAGRSGPAQGSSGAGVRVSRAPRQQQRGGVSAAGLPPTPSEGDCPSRHTTTARLSDAGSGRAAEELHPTQLVSSQQGRLRRVCRRTNRVVRRPAVGSSLKCRCGTLPPIFAVKPEPTSTAPIPVDTCCAGGRRRGGPSIALQEELPGRLL